jgi:hypothetical protein
MCDFMHPITGRRFELWVVVVTALISYLTIPSITGKFFERAFACRSKFNEHQLYALLLILSSFLTAESVQIAATATLLRYHWLMFAPSECAASEYSVLTHLFLTRMTELGKAPDYLEFMAIMTLDGSFSRTFQDI